MLRLYFGSAIHVSKPWVWVDCDRQFLLVFKGLNCESALRVSI